MAGPSCIGSPRPVQGDQPQPDQGKAQALDEARKHVPRRLRDGQSRSRNDNHGSDDRRPGPSRRSTGPAVPWRRIANASRPLRSPASPTVPSLIAPNGFPTAKKRARLATLMSATTPAATATPATMVSGPDPWQSRSRPLTVVGYRHVRDADPACATAELLPRGHAGCDHADVVPGKGEKARPARGDQ